MPTLEIRGLPQRDPAAIPRALSRVCLAVAEAHGRPESQAWATWQIVEPGHYVEGTEAAGLQPPDSHPPIGRIVCFEGRSPGVIAATLEATMASLTDALGVSGVFLEQQEAHSGRVVAGEAVIRRWRPRLRHAAW